METGYELRKTAERGEGIYATQSFKLGVRSCNTIYEKKDIQFFPLEIHYHRPVNYQTLAHPIVISKVVESSRRSSGFLGV